MNTDEYMVLFLDETNELLLSISDNLLELEKHPFDFAVLDEIFRSAHTLKGMAAMMKFHDIASLIHKMENVLDKIRKRELPVTEQVINTLMETLEDMEKLVGAINSGEDGSGPAERMDELGKEKSPLLGKQYERGMATATELALDDNQLDMQRVARTMRKAPVELVFNRFPQMVRGLAEDLNKKIDFDIIGGEAELDRTVAFEIGDLLVHLIRNSVDHGIESPEERKAKGKPEKGNLTLRAYNSGTHVFFEIEDDGAGMSREEVAKKAIENGLLSADRAAHVEEEDVYRFIFSSGFSTSENVSDISGRGVGLDAVRMKVEELDGNIAVESEQGTGSKFSIQLPLTS